MGEHHREIGRTGLWATFCGPSAKLGKLLTSETYSGEAEDCVGKMCDTWYAPKWLCHVNRLEFAVPRMSL